MGGRLAIGLFGLNLMKDFHKKECTVNGKTTEVVTTIIIYFTVQSRSTSDDDENFPFYHFLLRIGKGEQENYINPS